MAVHRHPLNRKEEAPAPAARLVEAVVPEPLAPVVEDEFIAPPAPGKNRKKVLAILNEGERPPAGRT
jgi:hypothetical protein